MKGVPDPELCVNRNLRRYESLCILDGLDEVRPNLVQAICDRINAFYQEFFSPQSAGTLIVTCRKEAYRELPLDLPQILEVRPLSDEQIRRFAKKWPLSYPPGKSADSFIADLFATTRIHELARSPLLLVGGLMQYTESNLGIPEERVQYLARVAQWLVSDWATAQGHPPDRFRTLYPRILSRLALHLHLHGRSECPSAEAVNLIASWLPGYGFDGTEANAVLSGLLTRTGILVRDVPQLIIFSQFGLQEYYASIDFLESVEPGEVVRFANQPWWREVILLAVAQQKEPTAYVDLLFSSNPLLAAEAVAESPTPSMALQQRAVESCLRAIDGQATAARTATVRLLRKIKGALEKRLVSELEIRLTADTTAQTAGLVLALAGTPEATAALARHPAVWGTCLQNAGYLSSSLENLLVVWIREGDETQSRHAADLLSSRLSSDRFEQLLGILPTLQRPKANHVTRMLLRRITEQPDEARRDLRLSISNIATCVTRLDDPLPWPKIGRQIGPWRVDDPGQFVFPALALRYTKPNTSTDRLISIMANTSDWTEMRGTLLCYVGSAVILSMGNGRAADFGALLGAMIAVAGVMRFFPRYFAGSIPWFMHRRHGVPPLLTFCLVSVGMAIFALLNRGPLLLVGGGQLWPHSALAALCGLLGFALVTPSYPQFRIFESPSKTITQIAAWILVALAVLSIPVYASARRFPARPLQVVGALFLVVFVSYSYQLHRDYRLTLGAIERAENEESSRRAVAQPGRAS